MNYPYGSSQQPAYVPHAGGGAYMPAPAEGYPDPQFNGGYDVAGMAPAGAYLGAPAAAPQYSGNYTYQQHQQPDGGPYAPQYSPAPEVAPPATQSMDENGLRWTWSTYPNTQRVKTKEHATVASIMLPEMIVPMSCMYTPLAPVSTAQLVYGDPAQGYQCSNCGAYANLHCPLDGNSWTCLACLRRNTLPPHHVPQLPAMHKETVEYILPTDKGQPQPRPAFVFIVDVCLSRDELEALKGQLLQCLQWLRSNALIGLVSTGAHTSVWELGPSAMSKCYVLRGDRAYTREELEKMLQVSDTAPAVGRLLVPLSECEFVFTTLLEELQCDTAALPSTRRPQRTTGTAVDVATFLMESLQAHTNPNKETIRGVPPVGAVGAFGKVILFSGGPCTRGPGSVVSTDKAEMMRFHRDIIERNTPLYDAAFEFYKKIAERLAAVCVSLDVFAESFDQIGIMEMRACVNETGGTFICGDSCADDIFSQTFAKYFKRCDFVAADEGGNATAWVGGVRCAFGARMELHSSADTLVSGILGTCVGDAQSGSGGWNNKQSSRAVSPQQIGAGGTTRWHLGTVDPGTTLAILFDTATLEGGGGSGTQQPGGRGAGNRFLQFVTRFIAPNGERRVRVTSVVQPIAPTSASPAYFTEGQAFDQTCASTVVARMAVSILERFPNKWDDTKRWLDTLLVRFVRCYGTFSANIPDSLKLSPSLALFPSFMFNLRRSEYFMVLNISPDETTFKRHWLMREDVDKCVRMIQPTLDSYDFEAPYAVTVPLDSASLRHDNIVLMDAFFNVHIMWGTTIYEWIQEGYHDNPDYAHFAALLDSAETDAKRILESRYPHPRFSRTDAEGSEARHVKNRVNPATSYQSMGAEGGLYGGGAGQRPNGDTSDMIYTDDASIMKFMASLKQAVVTPVAAKREKGNAL